MKRIFYLITVFSFLFFSCIIDTSDPVPKPTPTPDNPSENTKTEMGTVFFENKSNFDVKIYAYLNPY